MVRQEVIDYLKHFDKIDIPITYFISTEDNLCRADCIMYQFEALHKHNPSLAHVKLFEGYSHIDFTYLIHHTMICEEIKTLKNLD
jgi:hypothetical protein